MEHTIRLLVSILLVCNLPVCFAEEKIQIALPDTYLRVDQVTTGDGWWGLFSDGDEYRLEATSLTESTFEFENPDSSTGRESAVTLSIPQEEKPVAIIRGMSNLKPGRVTGPLRPETPRFLFPGEIQDVTVTRWSLESQMQVAATGTAAKPGGYAVEFSNYDLFLTKGSALHEKRQVLIHVPYFTSWALPSVLWAGDLDNDGRTDLILSRSTSESLTDVALYLSSAASKGELVGLVARWSAHKGC